VGCRPHAVARCPVGAAVLLARLSPSCTASVLRRAVRGSRGRPSLWRRPPPGAAHAA
jgi:hypothetical protein